MKIEAASQKKLLLEMQKNAVSIAARGQLDALVEREKFLAREAELNAKISEHQLALEKNKNSEATRRLEGMQAQLQELQLQNLLAKENLAKQNLEYEQNLVAFNNLVMDKDDQTMVSELSGLVGIPHQYDERDDSTTDHHFNANKCGIEFSDNGCNVNCAKDGFEMMVPEFLKWFMGDGENSCGSSFWECSSLDGDAAFKEKKANYKKKKKKKKMKEEEETMKSTKR